MGRSLIRCKIGSSPFQHCSIDPLGPIGVAFPGSGTDKLTPLIMCDLNTGIVAMESMVGCKAENVFLALQRLQFRFSTEIVQAFTDKGSQRGKILGKTKNYWREQLGRKLKVYNNLASCQYRNVCKRKVRTFKRLLKMGMILISGA